MENELKKEVRSINLISIFKEILGNWPWLLVVFLVFSIFGATQNYLKQRKIIDNNSEQIQQMEKDSQGFVSTAEFNNKISDSVSKSLDERMKYINNSIISQLDYNCYSASAIVFINTDQSYKVFELTQNDSDSNTDTKKDDSIEYVDDNVRFVQDSLNEFIKTSIDYKAQADSFGVEDERYVIELIQTQKSGCNLILKTYSVDEKSANDLLVYIIDCISSDFNNYLKQNNQYELEIASFGTNKVQSPYTEWIADNVEYIEELVAAQNKMNLMQSDLQNYSFSNQYDIKKNTVVSKTSVIKNAVVFGMIGLFCATCLYALLLILSDKVFDIDELRDTLNIKNILFINNPTDKDSVFKRVQTSNSKGKYSNAALFLDAINSFDPKKTKIAVVSELDESAIKLDGINDLIQNESRIYDYKYNILSDYKALETLSKYDGLIIAVKKNKTTFSAIQQVIDIAKNKETEVIGCIII